MYEDIFLLVIAIGFFTWTIRSLYKHVVFFQKLPHSFLYPKQNKARFIFFSLFSYSGILSWALLGACLYMTVTDLSTLYIQTIIAVLFIVKFVMVVKEIQEKKLFNVYIYSRSLVLLIVSFLCVTMLFFYPLTISAIWILLLERVTFFIALILLFIFGFPTELLDDVAIKKAARRIKSFKLTSKVLILGGEKDEISWMISEILESDRIAILPSTILTRGDLAAHILELRNPPDVILLSINSQNTHLSKIAIEVLQPTICVIAPSYISQESNVLNVRSFSESLNKQTKIILPVEYERPARLFLRKHSLFYYASEKNVSLHNGAYVDDVVYKKSGIHFSINLSTQTLAIETNSIDKDFIDYIVPASLVAKVLHIPMKRVEAFAAKVAVPSSMFSLMRSKKKVICIDGSGISSVDKIVREVEYLRVLGNSMIIIIGKLSPFTSKKDMLLLGNSLNEIAGSVILLNHEYLRPLRAGMKDLRGNSKVVCLTMPQVQKLVSNVGANEKIVLLGHQTDLLIRIILNES